ncbi:sterol desaturase family protein [Vreelandella neptunia]|uniref:Sterol desaturase family protein n=1 Tax=Vreelandella neptunia TaxID=115551 RepID=A0ABZ0YNC0_9GAMM|nr:sterol desaturase family protein [Halomonas neptunia]MDN3558665.1 sterol desaturase family protein [Halomonas neptunia]TDV92131.1 beta-carotene 3-hydroxylase [Halomonas alkaliantarctica]WQH13635.1 sterol desaturase family protein [Halomonas neptunia]
MMDWFWTFMLVIAAFLGMEVFAWYAHKYIMHGLGWRWHKSHHEPTEGVFEKNDLYVVVFSLVVVGMFAVGDLYWKPLMAIASGITLYGVAYSLFHDGMVHQRWPIRWQPKSGYLKRLVQAHRIHHAVRTREGAVSFGFLYAPDVRKLKKRLQQQRAAPPAGARHDR